MINQIRPAIVLTLAFTLLTGVAYPLAMTGIGQAMFPAQANGSRITQEGVTVGSSLIGQGFTQPDYFWPRPSATGPEPYNAAASSGSNYGPTDARLVKRVATLVASLGDRVPVPADAVTTSASGLDPHITPANARMQIARVADARAVDAASMETLLADMTETPVLGIFGEPRVNLLALNLALDHLAPPAR
jgi:K+-transporting ATPase ATPase C chain